MAVQAKRGLEIGGFAAVDLQHWTAVHLLAFQTPTDEQSRVPPTGLMQHYIHLLKTHANGLKQKGTRLCVDTYFSKKNYVDAAVEERFQLVSRLHSDVVLRYLYQSPKPSKRGRPKTYDGKVNSKNLDERYFRLCVQDENLKAYEALVNAKEHQSSGGA